MIAFIDLYRNCFLLECICRVMNKPTVGGFITSRGYRLVKKRPPNSLALRDAVLVGEVRRVFEENYRVLGGRKLWHTTLRESWNIGRDQVSRLIKIAGISGVHLGRKPVTTRPSPTPDTRPDLVQRQFSSNAPNRMWDASITYGVPSPSLFIRRS